ENAQGTPLGLLHQTSDVFAPVGRLSKDSGPRILASNLVLRTLNAQGSASCLEAPHDILFALGQGEMIPWVSECARDREAAARPADERGTLEKRRERVASGYRIERDLARDADDVRVDPLGLRQEFAAHARSRSVGAEEDVALGARATLKARN